MQASRAWRDSKQALSTMHRTKESIDRISRQQLIKTDSRADRREVKDFLKKPMAVVLFCYMHEPTAASVRAVDDMPLNTLGELIAAFIAKVKLGNPSPQKLKNRDEQFLRYLGFRMNCDGVFTVSGSRYDTLLHMLPPGTDTQYPGPS